MQLLLVEDHADTAGMMKAFFESIGYSLKIATSVASALELAANECFNLVISDIGLPDASGYDLMKQLRDRHGLHGIALSGYGMAADIERSQEVGFIDHLVKPVDFARLDTAIRRALQYVAQKSA